MSKWRIAWLLALLALAAIPRPAPAQQESGRAPARTAKTYPLEVLPPEHRMMKDPVTGVDLIFVTTDPAPDNDLYFHEQSWLSDSSMLLFTSGRAQGGLMGYLFATGELVRLTTPQGGLGGATAARFRPSVFAYRGREILELALRIEPSPDPATAPSTVTATERVIGAAPEGMGSVTALNENSNGALLSLGVSRPGGVGIIVINIKTGKVREVCRMKDFGGHVQFSRTSPYLISFAGRPDRLMVVDIRDGQPRNIHKRVEGETVTHECWWVNDQLTFCGGYRDGDSPVRVIDAATGVIRIIGSGSWWPEGTPAELARWNWWHAAGSETGRWVVADNWHGDIVLFDGRTTQMRRLTLGHRTYGRGDHPEPGWDRRGERVAFTSQMLGNSDVCVATIPPSWH